MHSVRFAFAILMALGFGITNIYAQWTPVISNIRLTTETTKDGKLTKQVKEGVFYRSENGSTLTHWTRGDSDTRHGSGELFDNQTLATYEIFYEAKKMIEKPNKLSAPRKPNFYMDLKPVGADSVGGVECDLITVEMMGPDRIKQRAGYACVARELGLLLRQDLTNTMPNGGVHHSLLELYDIRLNAPPDSNEFAVVHNFSILKPEAKIPLRPPDN